MGSKQKRGDTWYITVSLGRNPKTGKYERYTETVRGSAREANDRIAELENQIAKNQFVRPSNKTVRELFSFWLEEVIKPTKAEKTYTWYEMNYRVHIDPEIGHIALKDLTSIAIQKMYNKIMDTPINRTGKSLDELTEDEREAKKPRSRASGNGVHRTLRAGLEYARRKKWIRENPALDVEAPYMSQKEMAAKRRTLKADEAICFLDKNRDEHEYPLYLAALTTAMRQGELLGLQLPYVNLDEMTIFVCQVLETNQDGSNPRIVGVPKTDNSYRYIRMTKTLASEIKKIIKKREKIVAAGKTDKWNLVFCQEDGTPYNPVALTKYTLKKHLKNAELPPIRFHDLRHTTASLLKKLKIDTRTISDICGHSSASFTDRQYIHTDTDYQDEAMDKLDAIFEQRKTSAN